MINLSTTEIARRAARRGRQIGARALLAPEAIVVVLLFLGALAFDRPPLIGALITVAVALLVLRVGALYLAQHAMITSQLRWAESLAQLALWLNPWSADALMLRGSLALTSGDAELAADLLRRAVSLCPDSAVGHAALSSTLLTVGHIAAARLSAQRAIELSPACTAAYVYMAEAERASGADALVVEDWLRAGLAVAARPDDEAALRCALSGLLYSEGRVAESTLVLGGLDRLIERCAPVSRARLRLRYGELLLAQGQDVRARDYLQSVCVLPRAAS